ncbi:hypothetical protein AB3R30_21645 [Leptolyngbyaceae cyanobacterium UHCC 1019]
MTDEELLRVIEQASTDKIEDLDLSEQGLRSLPPESGTLKTLRLPHLNRNRIRDIASDLAPTSQRSLS